MGHRGIQQLLFQQQQSVQLDPDPFPREHRENQPEIPGDHAGKVETSETMAIYPELVELDRIDDSLWFARDGREATADYGNLALDVAAKDIEITLFGKQE